MTDGRRFPKTYTYNTLGQIAALQKSHQRNNLSPELRLQSRRRIKPPSLIHRLASCQQSFDTIGRLCAVGSLRQYLHFRHNLRDRFFPTTPPSRLPGFSTTATVVLQPFSAIFLTALLLQKPRLLQGRHYALQHQLLVQNRLHQLPQRHLRQTTARSSASLNNVGLPGAPSAYAYDTFVSRHLRRHQRLRELSPVGLVHGPTIATANRLKQQIAKRTTAPQPTRSAWDATTNHINTSGYAYDSNGKHDQRRQTTPSSTTRRNRVSPLPPNGRAPPARTLMIGKQPPREEKSPAPRPPFYVFLGSEGHRRVFRHFCPLSSRPRIHLFLAALFSPRSIPAPPKYYHQDHLSNRVVTDSSGNALEQVGHYPFGESWYNATSEKSGCSTTYERDAESGKTTTPWARSYVNRLGPLSPSPDPLSGSTGNPQSLNRFAYVLNDPTKRDRPLGASIPADNNPNDLRFPSVADPIDGGDPGTLFGGAGVTFASISALPQSQVSNFIESGVRPTFR